MLEKPIHFGSTGIIKVEFYEERSIIATGRDTALESPSAHD